MIWGGLLYDWPEAALLLFAAPLLVLGFIALYQFRRDKLNALAAPDLLTTISQQRRKTPFWIKSFLYCVAWVCGVLALMQPKGNERYVIPPSERAAPQGKAVIRQQAHDVIFLMDASASMAVDDTREGTPRLDLAKVIADGIISRLTGETIALHAFTTSTIQISPLTTDYIFVRLMLREVGINEGNTEGTDLLQALETMKKNYFASSAPVRKTLVVLSDGGDTHFESLKDSEREAYLAKFVRLFDNADALRLRVYVIGIGSKQGKDIPNISYQGHPVMSAVDETLLRKISIAAGGQAFFTSELSTLQVIEGVSDAIAREPPQWEEKSISQRMKPRKDQMIYDEYYQVPLAVAMIALALSLLIPETGRRKQREDV